MRNLPQSSAVTPSEVVHAVPPTAAQMAGSDVTRSLMDLTLTIGELKNAVVGLEQSNRRIEQQMEKVESKLASRIGDVEDQVAVINKHLFAAWVVTALIVAVGGWVLNQVWDVTKPLLQERLASTPAAVAAPTNPSAPADTHRAVKR